LNPHLSALPPAADVVLSGTMRLSLSQSFLSEPLDSLLTREAAFTLAKHSLSSALDEARGQERELRITRPPFLFLAASETKKKFSSTLAETIQLISQLETGLATLNQFEPRLREVVGSYLEQHLRTHSPDYLNRLASYRYPGDWDRLLATFDAAAEGCRECLVQLISLASTLPSNLPLQNHEEARRIGALAVAHATRIEEEIAFLNKIASAQRKQAGLGNHTLNHQPEHDWTGTVQSILTIEAKIVAINVTPLIQEMDLTLRSTRNAIRDECVHVRAASRQGVPSYHAAQWDLLRQPALLKVPPDHLQAIVHETEVLLEKNQLIAWAEALRTRTPPQPVQPVSVTPPAPSPTPEPPPKAVASPQPPALKLPSRATVAPFGPPPSVAPPATPPAAPQNNAANYHETHTDLTARENFVQESELRLLEKTQEQIERATELEQREEELRALEKRLLSLQQAQNPAAPPAPSEKKAFDEFNE
jgi:hypothetical protein